MASAVCYFGFRLAKAGKPVDVSTYTAPDTGDVPSCFDASISLGSYHQYNAHVYTDTPPILSGLSILPAGRSPAAVYGRRDYSCTERVRHGHGAAGIPSRVAYGAALTGRGDLILHILAFVWGSSYPRPAATRATLHREWYETAIVQHA